MTYGTWKYLTKRKAFDKVLHSEVLVMMDISVGLLQWSTSFLIKNLETLLFTQGPELFLKIKNYPMNYIDQSLESFTSA